jgi:hypothetical protein
MGLCDGVKMAGLLNVKIPPDPKTGTGTAERFREFCLPLHQEGV